MSFMVRKTKYRAWPVTVKQSECDDIGVVTKTEATFVAHFAPFTEAEIEDAIAEAEKKYPLPKGVTLPPMSLTLQRNAHVFQRVIVGWGPEVTDEAGKSIAFSVDELTKMVTGPDGILISHGFNRALFECRYGVAREKNSLSSPAPGASSAPAEAETSSPTISPSSE